MISVLNPSGRAHHDRLHGMLRCHQCAEVSSSHCAICTGGGGAGFEPGSFARCTCRRPRISSRCCRFFFSPTGCAACLVSADPKGLGIDGFLALRIPETSHLILLCGKFAKWVSTCISPGQVPTAISKAMKEAGAYIKRPGKSRSHIVLWAVHPGGRTVSGCGRKKDWNCVEDSPRSSSEVLFNSVIRPLKP